MDQEIADLTHEPGSSGGVFRIGEDATLTYSRSGDHVITALYAEVHPRARGKGLGLVLYEAMVAWARENDLKVIPACSFVRVMFRRHPEHADLLA